MTDAPIYIVPNSIYIPIKVDNITRLFESKEEEKQQYRRLGSDDTLRARYEGKLVGERALMRVCMRFDGYEGGEFRIAGGKLQQMMYGARDVRNLCVTLDEHAESSDAAIQDHWSINIVLHSYSHPKISVHHFKLRAV